MLVRPSVRLRPSTRTRSVWRREAAAKQQMLIYVPPHPLVKHWVAIARNAATPPSMFRGAIAELGRVLLYEAGREFLQTVDADVQTPLAETTVTFVDPVKPVKVQKPDFQIGIQKQYYSVIPVNQVYHIGIQRDDLTLQVIPPSQDASSADLGFPQPSWYYNNLPPAFSPDDQIIVLDIMIATGGSMMLVLNELVRRGASAQNIRVICAVTAPPALKQMSESFPEMQVYAGIIDAEVDGKGYIIPGMGDAGDRAFGTM